jgi:hypothetical protein
MKWLMKLKNTPIYLAAQPQNRLSIGIKIGKIAEENPDMPFEFIKGILEAMQEESIPFEFTHINKK